MLSTRRATPEDRAIIAANNIAMAEETEGKHIDPEVADRGVAGMFGDKDRGFYLLAERDGAVVGQLMVTHEWSDWRAADFWWIQSVYIAPQARRTGVYRELYRRLQEMAKEAGNVCGFRLYVALANETAQLTYRSLGMENPDYDMYEAALGG